MSTRSYTEAVDRLNSLQSNAATLEAVRASGGRLSEFAIPEMVEYLGRIGYQPEDLNKLNVIHVTGTKGKGSTCAFVDSILRQERPDWKIGLYTSPHLVAVRERIRVNGAPLSEEQFTKFFFEVWDRLEVNKTRKLESTSDKPAYFRFVTLVAYHAFLSLKVNATVLEVGVGGRFDSTNIVPKPRVTGITALGIDHVAVLGKTLPEIAWQKAGIYKAGVPALTVDQPAEGMSVLKQQAAEVNASEFRVVNPPQWMKGIKLGLQGTHQHQNAVLAVHLVDSFLGDNAGALDSQEAPPTFVSGLAAARWPGRCQEVVDPLSEKTRWYLDGAHTLESLSCCAQWFFSAGVGLPEDPKSSKKGSRVLIFNCTNGRSGEVFLGVLLAEAGSRLRELGSPETVGALFDEVVFCANVTYADGAFKGDLTTRAIPESDLAQLRTQQALADAWFTLVSDFPITHVHVLPSIEHAVRVVRSKEESGAVSVLVAGSLHLVGGVIEVAGLAEVAL